MNDMLYLTADEHARFGKLPESLRTRWNTEREELTAYETPEELQMRQKMLEQEYPNLQEFFTSDFPQKELPDEWLLSAFFTLGAVRISMLIESILDNAQRVNDMETIAFLSQIRHMVLESNAEVATSPSPR